MRRYVNIGLRGRVRAAIAAVPVLMSALLAGCIKNDLPYPVVECRIESIAAEGLAADPQIDFSARRVTLPLLETTDIQNVTVTDVVLTEGATSSVELTGRHDLRGPKRVTLSLYQDYEWELAAEQNIERSFSVEGQVGAAVWDFSDRTVRVYVGFDDLSDVRIKSLKLGPAGITRMSCVGVGDFDETSDFGDRIFSQLRDFSDSHFHQVFVSCHGRTETWLIYVEHTEATVTLTRADGWVRTAWLYGDGLSGTELGFRYRRQGDDQWTTVPQSAVETDGGAFSARIRGLEPECEYEAVAYSGDDESAVTTFTTQPELPLPNSGFEDWSQSGNVIYPYLTGDVPFWDTGNKGSTTLGPDYNITTGVTDTRPGSSGRMAAQLVSRYVVLKFAAGNIFVGKYESTVGTNGKINFGHPFASRPVALRGWVKFVNGPVDRIGKQPSDRTLTANVDLDEGMIYIALGTWTAAKYGGTADSPVQVYSADEKTFFNKNAPDVVAYGERVFTASTDGWVQFEIPIDYRATDIIPTHLVLVCSASRWGDYFSGSTQNRMWLDDFELVWE